MEQNIHVDVEKWCDDDIALVGHNDWNIVARNIEGLMSLSKHLDGKQGQRMVEAKFVSMVGS